MSVPQQGQAIVGDLFNIQFGPQVQGGAGLVRRFVLGFVFSAVTTTAVPPFYLSITRSTTRTVALDCIAELP
jgi:cytochrome c biogenesis protein CcdA